MPTNEVMHMAHLWLCRAPVTTVIAYTGHSSHTVCTFFSYFRQLVADSLDVNELEVGGPGVIVEIDESKFGKRKYHRGHRVDGVWVLGGVERTSLRRVFLAPVPDRSAKTLLEVISKHVLPGSIIFSDMWKGYNGISEQLGLEHFVVNHSVEFVDRANNVHTNCIEGTWAGIKIRMPVRNRVLNSITEHLFEFIWRRCHEENLWDGFLHALRDVGYD